MANKNIECSCEVLDGKAVSCSPHQHNYADRNVFTLYHENFMKEICRHDKPVIKGPMKMSPHDAERYKFRWDGLELVGQWIDELNKITTEAYKLANRKNINMNDPKMKKLQQAEKALHAIHMRKEAVKRLQLALVREKVDMKFQSCEDGDVTACCFNDKSRTTLAELAINLLNKEIKELEAQYKKL
jgi:hypothetical protein